MVEKGKGLCEDLIANVKEHYEEFKARPPRHSGYGDHHGRGHSHGGNSYSSYNRYNSESAQSHSPAPGVQSPANAADYAAQYAQYYNGADPYAAYGGYAKYVCCIRLAGRLLTVPATWPCTNNTMECKLNRHQASPRLRHLPQARQLRLRRLLRALLLRPLRPLGRRLASAATVP
jgi:hypothetical protein